MRPVSALLAFAGGCATCPPLSEVPIRGATDAEQAEIRAELSRLERDLALPVCVDHVRVRDRLPRGNHGVYSNLTHLVHVARDSVLAPTVRHEVCHAVDFQNDVVLGREGWFPYPEATETSRDYAPNEAFALICQIGPAGLGPMWDTDCPEPDLRALRVVREEVWGLERDPPAAVLSFQPIASVHLQDAGPIDGAWFLRLSTDIVEDSLRIYVQGTDLQYASFSVDAWTGAIADDGALSPAAPPEPPAAPANWWDGSYEPTGGTLLDGTGVVTAMHALPTGSRLQRTLAVEDLDAEAGPTFSPADGPCPNGTTQYFTFDGEPWMGQLDGEVVSWGRWRRPQAPAAR